MDAAAGRDFLAASRAYVARVEDALRGAIQAAPDRIGSPELIAALAPQLGGWPQANAAGLIFPFAGHLERLQALRLVEGERGAQGTRWRWRTAGG